MTVMIMKTIDDVNNDHDNSFPVADDDVKDEDVEENGCRKIIQEDRMKNADVVADDVERDDNQKMIAEDEVKENMVENDDVEKKKMMMLKVIMLNQKMSWMMNLLKEMKMTMRMLRKIEWDM